MKYDLNSSYAEGLERQRAKVTPPARGFLLDKPMPRQQPKSAFLLALKLRQTTRAAQEAMSWGAALFAELEGRPRAGVLAFRPPNGRRP